MNANDASDHAVVMVRLPAGVYEKMVEYTPSTNEEREEWRRAVIKKDNIQKASECLRDICNRLKEVAEELEDGGKDNYRAERMILHEVSECVRAIDYIETWDDVDFTLSTP